MPQTKQRITANELFRKVAGDWDLVPCRWCGAPAELWQRRGKGDVWVSFGSCTNDEYIDEESCPFGVPCDEDFYCDRKAAAVAYWNRIMGLPPLKPGPMALGVFALTAELRRYFEEGTLEQDTRLYALLQDVKALRVAPPETVKPHDGVEHLARYLSASRTMSEMPAQQLVKLALTHCRGRSQPEELLIEELCTRVDPNWTDDEIRRKRRPNPHKEAGEGGERDAADQVRRARTK